MRTLGATAAFLLAGLAACDAPETTWRQRTAEAWARDLWSKDAERVAKSRGELVAFARRAPELVVDAVARELAKAPPDPVATPFALAIDREAGRRLGLAEADTPEVARLDLPVLRARAEALRLPVTAWRTTGDGQIDAALSGGRSRADVERLQALLSTRGALEVRSAGGETLLDDRAIAAATLDRALDGRPFVVAHVKPERVEDVRGALAREEGKRVSVVLDGTPKAEVPAPVVAGGRVALPLWREAGASADREASDLALVLSTGRLEWPLRPVPLGADVGVGPPADNPFSSTLVEIGAPAAATLSRLATDAPHEWTRRSAAWARDRLLR
jgi:hypothetical protein